MWSIVSLIFFYFVSSYSTNITCYTNSTIDETISCDSYCELTYSSSDGYGQQCADDGGSAYCDIFGAKNKCIQATLTTTNYETDCNNGVFSYNITTSSDTFQIECCDTNECNNAFTTTCTTSSSLQSYVSYSISCLDDASSNYVTYGQYECGNISAYATQSTCNIASVSVLYDKCGCESFIYVYNLATTDAERSELLLYTNLTDFDLNETMYGCSLMSTCSLTNGFSYSITSYSFSITLSVTGLTTSTYDSAVIITLVASTLSTSGYDTDTSQVYISSTTLTSSGTSSTLVVVVQYSTMTEATTVRNAVAAGDVTFASSTISATGTVQSNSYTTPSTSDGYMNKFISISLLLSIISLLFN